ncbi:MAG TPA: hemerythrin domain-containing protein, partial [Segeticoccus sp.]|uniref:hemerythrin domain-containing protein n=1 Tax=Segeticoccus sp. TaxID=2706531 RepID=UPI002D7E461D
MQFDTTSTPQAVADRLHEQHETIKHMLDAVATTSGQQRRHAFDDLRMFLACHEAAEEQFIHPEGEHDLKDGAVSSERVSEEQEAGHVITQLEGLDVDSEEFEQTFAKLTEAVVHHAEAEEHDELPAVSKAADAAALGAIDRALRYVPEMVGQTGSPLGQRGQKSFEEMLSMAQNEFSNLQTGPGEQTKAGTTPEAVEDRAKASKLPEGDVIRVLLEQHARIHDLFHCVQNESGEHKQQAFDELRALLAVHETGEEMVLRPVSKDAAGKDVAEARNKEEQEANEVLQKLEKMDTGSTEFDQELATFKKSVADHAESEENEEFPKILAEVTGTERLKLGQRLRTAEKVAPTHPHPSSAGKPGMQWAVGPFASLVDRTKDAL